MDSKQWLRRQQRDQFVSKAKAEGYRSRAACKLIELDRKLKLFHKVGCVIDLGAAPGGWSQVAVRLSSAGTRVFALDLLPMEPVEGVEYLQGDFCEDAVRTELSVKLGQGKADLVLSDMAPNLSGIVSVDQFVGAALVEQVIRSATDLLKPSGVLVTKTFHGSEFQQVVELARQHFVQVKIVKPKASRSESKEVYLYAKMLAS